jgi:hypothetical protein
MMANEVQLYSVPDMQVMAKAMAGTGMFGFKRPEEAFALMLIAQAEGKHPATIAQEYDIIQGRPALKSMAALARFQHAGGSIQWHTRTDLEASATFSHAMGGDVRITWTMDRAGKAGLTGKDNWKKFSAQMLSARVVSEGVRACLPACLNGMYVAEEVQDFEPRKASAPAGMDPRNEVTQTALEPTRLEKIHTRYLAKCAAARETLGRDLPAVYEPSADWTEADYTTAAKDLDEALEGEREGQGQHEATED